MKYSKYLVIGAVILSVIAIVVALNKPVSVERIIEQVNQNLGATPTLDGVDHPYVKINGVETYYGLKQFMASSSNLCFFSNPYNSTSTLVSFNAVVTRTNFGSTAVSADVSTSSFAYGSSSPAFVKADTITGLDRIDWAGGASTTNINVGIWGRVDEATGNKPFFIGPTDYITLRIATGSPSSYATYSQGVCKAVIQKLP